MRVLVCHTASSVELGEEENHKLRRKSRVGSIFRPLIRIDIERVAQ